MNETAVLKRGHMKGTASRNDRTLPCLTGARFGAALLVVLFHFGHRTPLPGVFFDYGRQAVSFFFILSGACQWINHIDATA